MILFYFELAVALGHGRLNRVGTTKKKSTVETLI